MDEMSSDLIFFPSASEYAKYFASVDELGAAIDPQTLYMLQMRLLRGTSGLLHLTKNLQSIAESGSVYPSAGGLGGVVYSVPVLGDSIHNLGEYLSEHEIPFFARGAYSGQNNKSAILFSTGKPRVGLVDYLSFGKTYHEIYASSEYLQKTIDPEQLVLLVKRNQLVITQAKQYLLDMDANCSDFLEEFATFLAESPLIQMLYFELLLEFVYLFQNDAESHRSIDNFELYSNNAKQLIFTLNPELANGFSLKKITSPPGIVEAYLVQMSNEGILIKEYKSGQFKSYLKSRLYEQLEFYFHDKRNLAGHVLFRCFDERRFLEIQLAEKLWKEGEQKNVQAVSYRMPKGEIGLLPGTYHTELGTITGNKFLKQSVGDLTVPKRFSLGITGTMRNPYDEKSTKTPHC